MTYHAGESFGVINDDERLDLAVKMYIIKVCRRKFEG